MKSKLLSIVLTCSLVFTQDIVAQQVKIRNVENAMFSEPPKIISAKKDIDMAFANAETANDVNMWCWRGIVYSYIANSSDSLISKLEPNAVFIAGQAFNNYFQFPKDSRTKYAEDASRYYPVAAIYCFNKGLSLASLEGGYNEVKTYMSFVETIVNNDDEKKLAEYNITIPKVYNILASSAKTDKNETEELYYLNKLADYPKYNNAYVFTRISEIYASKKDFDKALAVLNKGREKIPSQSAIFLQAEISIETDSSRNNTQGLLNKLTEGINEDPSNAVYYYNRGTVYYTLKHKEMDANVKPFKYFFSQALNDLQKALQLDPTFSDAMYNEAVTIMDSADYIYDLRTERPEKYDVYDKLCKDLYKQALDKLELLRQSGIIKDMNLVNMLDNMKKICAKIGDVEGKNRYRKMMMDEKERLKNLQNN
ncbi:MAG: tetratricopeptide repeat protein [Bacteroidota bacterium]